MAPPVSRTVCSFLFEASSEPVPLWRAFSVLSVQLQKKKKKSYSGGLRLTGKTYHFAVAFFFCFRTKPAKFRFYENAAFGVAMQLVAGIAPVYGSVSVLFSRCAFYCQQAAGCL